MRIEDMDPAVVEAAEALANANLEDEPNVKRVYLFPANDEIRLVEVDESSRPLASGERVSPFYFGPDVAGGIRFPMAKHADSAPPQRRQAG